MALTDTIRTWLASKISPAASTTVGGINNVTYSDAVMESFGVQSSNSGMAVTPLSAMRVAAVYACVTKISVISTIPAHVYRTDGDERERLPRDDLWYKLNEQPSDQFTAASHWEHVISNTLLRGDSFTWIRRSLNGSVKELLPLPWGSVFPIIQNGIVKYFISLPDFGISTWIDSSDILHFSGFGFNGVRSQSVISHAANSAVGNALAMDAYSGNFFKNGAHASISIEAPNKMSPEQVTQLSEYIKKTHSGSDNFHKNPLVLTEGLTAKMLDITAEDSQLLESRKFQVIDIARAFGVPPHMIGETSASTSWGSGIEAMSRGFVTYTLQPHLTRIEQELNRKLFPRNTGKFVMFDRDALIEGDSAAQAAYFRAALGGPGSGFGWMSPDEVRKSKGLKAKGGDFSKLFDPRTTQGGTNENNATVP